MHPKKILSSGTAVALTVAGALALGPAASATPTAATQTAGTPTAVNPAAATPNAGEAQSSSVPTPPPIAWGPCTSAALASRGAECGFVSVPLDYAKPNGRKIQLAISRIAHTSSAKNYQGVMLTNPGGPGGSGLTLSVLGEYVPHGVGDDYDWIGFDPRGVGSSKPALSCDPNYFGYDRPDYVPTTKAIETYWLTKTKRYAQACGAAQPALLQHVKTTDSAKDMESIRLALGRKQINYYGFSYGTYLGQVYGTLFPNRIRRMVLDSDVDPRKVWYQANLDQDVAFDRNINIWFGWVAKYDSVYHLGKSQKAVHDLWYAQKAALAEKPAGGLIGPDEWTDIFLGAGYYQQTWTELGSVFAGWVHRKDVATLKTEYDDANSVGDDNGYAMYAAVQCSDVQWPKDFATWRVDNNRVYKRAPFETWANAWYNAPCLNWPAKPGAPVQVDGSKVAPALLIDETLDAATPYQGSLEVRRRFPKASLLAEPGGTSHATTPNGNPCVDDTIARYLATGALPVRKPGTNRADATCQPLPQPVPTSDSTAQVTPKAAPAQPDVPLELPKVPAVRLRS